MSGEEGTLVSNAPAEVQTRALDLGWIPPERFKGSSEEFIDADEFVKRGEQILPIVKARNAKLEKQLAEQGAQIRELKDVVASAQESMKALEDFYSKETERKVAAVRQQLKSQIASASKDGDHEALAEATDQLTQLNAKEEQARREAEEGAAEKKAAAGRKASEAPEIAPEVQEWIVAHPWYGKDAKRTSYAEAVGVRLRREGNREIGTPFLDKIAEEVEEVFGPAEGSRLTDEKTTGGRPGNGRRGNGAKAYGDLPPEAKEACDGYNKTLVGKGKRFETVDAWRKHYATKYFEEV